MCMVLEAGHKKLLSKVLDITTVVLSTLMGLVVLYLAARIFVCDRFTVKGNSMEPTMHSGQKVWVNKLILGGRIYTNFDFESPDLKCFRMPGLRKLRVGDIAVFNYPRCGKEESIGFKINYVYAKRCVGTPGDTVWVKDSHVINSAATQIGIPLQNESRLRNMPDSLLEEMMCLYSGHFAGRGDSWTIKDMGPIPVPGKGMVTVMNPETAALYSLLIRYETGYAPKVLQDGSVALNGQEIDNYTFKEDYCLFFGDNLVDSKDSRYIGFVPEKYVIGVVWSIHK